MPLEMKTYRVLIASPSDLAVERDTMRTTLHEWNEQNAGRYRLMFQPVMWELNVRPQLGGRPQEIINQQLRDRDMVLAAFWTRIGTPTGMDLSGTVEEIRRCRDEGKDVLLYFSKRPVPVDTLDMDQLTQVRAFETLCHEQGITGEFDSPDDLRSKLMRHLTQFADEVTSGNSSPLVNAPAQSGAAAGASAAPGERRLQQEENLRESWHLLKLAHAAVLNLTPGPILTGDPGTEAKLKSAQQAVAALNKHLWLNRLLLPEDLRGQFVQADTLLQQAATGYGMAYHLRTDYGGDHGMAVDGGRLNLSVTNGDVAQATALIDELEMTVGRRLRGEE